MFCSIITVQVLGGVCVHACVHACVRVCVCVCVSVEGSTRLASSVNQEDLLLETMADLELR